MKSMRKFLALAMVLVMVLSMSVTAFAREPATSGSVTVYVTQNMFTIGGMDANGNVINQAYVGGTPTMTNANPNFYILNYEMSIAEIEEMVVDGMVRDDVYDAPTGLQTNVLDAIIAAFYKHGVYGIYGGWDANPVEGPAGGYIYSVDGQNLEYNETVQETVNGVTYDVYSGTGWNIACTQNGTISAIPLYGTNYPLVDGMQIVFDVSPYQIYYPAA